MRTQALISLDALNNRLFETIEMLMNNNNPKADEEDKIDLDSARTVAGLGKVIVESYKVKADVLRTLTSPLANPSTIKELANGFGLEQPKLLTDEKAD